MLTADPSYDSRNLAGYHHPPSRVVALYERDYIALDVRMIGMNIEHHALALGAAEDVVDLRDAQRLSTERKLAALFEGKARVQLGEHIVPEFGHSTGRAGRSRNIIVVHGHEHTIQRAAHVHLQNHGRA